MSAVHHPTSLVDADIDDKDDDDRKDDDIVQGVQCLSEESGLPARCEPSQLPESANNLHHQIRTGFQVMFSNKTIKKVQTIIKRGGGTKKWIMVVFFHISLFNPPTLEENQGAP